MYYNQIFHQNSPWIGLISVGLGFIGSPLITFICTHTRFPPHRLLWIGFFLSVTGVFSSAFCTSLGPLIVTQGVIFGLGVMFFQPSAIFILNTWFVKRRGLANSLVWCGSDLSALIWTFLVYYLLRTLSFRNAMLIQAAIVLVAASPSLVFLRQRPVDSKPQSQGIPASYVPDRERLLSIPFDAVAQNLTPPESYEGFKEGFPKAQPTVRHFLRKPSFYIFLICSVVQGLAYYLPYNYLPSFITALGLSQFQATTILAVANLAQIVGELGFGHLSDKTNVNILVIGSNLPTALFVFFLWGMVQSEAMVIAFALLYAVFGSGFLALLARMGAAFGEQYASVAYGILLFARGSSSILGGLIGIAFVGSGQNVVMDKKIGADKGSYGGPPQYHGLIMFVGASMAFTALLGAAGFFIAFSKKAPGTSPGKFTRLRNRSGLWR